MRSMLRLVVVCSLVLCAIPLRAMEVSFSTTLRGANEVPPVDSPATGQVTAQLNEDDTLTYQVTSSGFATPFIAAHLHNGPAGVGGRPILFFLSCNADGSACAGTSPRLSSEIRAALLIGHTYINLHSQAWPSGEIRGQLTLDGTTPAPATEHAVVVGKVTGTATYLGPGAPRKGADVKIVARFSAPDRIELGSATGATIVNLLAEHAGVGELVHGLDAAAAVPMALAPARVDADRGEAMFRAAAAPSCRVKLRARGKRAYDLTVRCQRDDGATIPVAPSHCTGARSTTTLVTDLVIAAATPLRLRAVQPWRCAMSRGVVRELKTTDEDSEDERGGDDRPPVADFRATPKKGDAPLTVLFTSRSTAKEGSLVAWSWDFGDGNTSAEVSPTHTYLGGGEFTASLVVTDDRGLTSRPKRQTITVKGAGVPIETENRLPVADFRAEPRRGRPPLAVAFTSRSSDSDGTLATHHWDFGDGGTSTEANPLHTYVQAGEYTATLVVVDDRGGLSAPKSETITVEANRLPEAAFDAEPRRGRAPLVVTFRSHAVDDDGQVTGWMWDFGDGETSTDPSPAHTYAAPGEYVATLIVTDDVGGASAPAEQTIKVTANRAPEAEFRAEPRTGDAPLTVTFTDRSSDDGQIVTRHWDFGDETTSDETNPVHLYTVPGEYEVTLTVTDDASAVSERPKRETILVR